MRTRLIVVKARAVEDRLMRESWQADGYDLLPKLRNLNRNAFNGFVRRIAL